MSQRRMRSAHFSLTPELAERLGAAGRERARALSWPRAAAEVEDVLDLVTGR